jgi:predicted RNA binding protein YcfA (HicA-like mRNA interferase family)
MASKNKTAAELVRRLESEGWVCVRQAGAHRQFKHVVKPGRVTVSVHRGTVPIGTLRNIYKQAGWQW